MYNNNNLSNKYSFSQKNIPINNPIFTSENYLNQYFNEQSPNNNQKRKFDEKEINKILESCKKNLKRLQNKYMNRNPIYFSTQNNNTILNRNNQTNNYISKNNIQKKKYLYEFKKRHPSNTNTNIYSNNFYPSDINIINDNKFNNNLNNRIKRPLSRNINKNICLNNKNDFFYSEQYIIDNNKIYNNNQINLQGFLSQRNLYNNENNQKYSNKVYCKMNKNNRNEEKVKKLDKAQDKYKINYITLINDLNDLKKTVVNYN